MGAESDMKQAWKLEFTLNGRAIAVDANPEQSLLDFLRMELGLTGTKGACLEGECGSCTVLIDGVAANSCLVMAGQVQGRTVTTVEGLASDGQLDLLQRKFVETGAVQCGYCTPGLIMAARELLDHAGECTEEQLRTAMEGNICRCTGYNKIMQAVTEAWRESRET
jgi:aerobic carbon-monoxide dehydrogenase small subunit